MAKRHYAFIRAEEPNFAQLQAAGWDTPLFAANDPRLAEQIARARQAGSQYGIWADPNWYQDKSPQAFAQQMASLYQQYAPAVVVPDIEFIGKGNQGSAGWDYNQQLAALWRQYLPGVETALTPMGNQSDFNYEAWNNIVSQWLPQSYGPNSNAGGDAYDPQNMIDVLVKAGVDPSLITPVLAASNNWSNYGGPAALWTYDDLVTGGLPHARDAVAQSVRQDDRTTQSSTGQAPVAPRLPRLSQSKQQVATGGLKWFGQTFSTPAQFKTALAQHGQSYATWAREHPQAAAGLVTRRPVPRGT